MTIFKNIQKKNLLLYKKRRKKYTMLKKQIKKINTLILEKKVQNTINFYPPLTSKIDKCVIKHIIHKNKAARYKKKINKKIKTLVLQYKNDLTN